MNHIYRIVFNHALGLSQVASEFTRAGGKTTRRSGAFSGKGCSPAGKTGLNHLNVRWPGILAATLALMFGSPVRAYAVDFTTGGGNGGNNQTAGYGLGGAGGVAGGGGGSGGNGAGGNGGAGATTTTNAQPGTAAPNQAPGGSIATGTPNLTFGGGGGGPGGSTDIADAGGTGASGTQSADVNITNTTAISGSAGGNSTRGGGGGGGGALVLTNSNVNVQNSGTVAGGVGGSEENTAYAGAGGGGGAGLVLINGGTVGNQGIIRGGAGGISGLSWSGSGGAGAFLYNGGSLNNSATGQIVGGAAGINVATNLNHSGNGAAGVLSNRGIIQNNGAITGGAAGAGGTSGSGITANGGSITNNAGGVITGGTGTGTAGGTGVILANDGGATLTNMGTISGGAGAAAVGVDVASNGNTMINAGSIIGTAGANALTLAGNNNTLELQAGFSFTGALVNSGSNNNLILGGAADASLNVTAYSGFANYLKTDASTWTLTGVNAGVTPWTIDNGALSISQDGNLGAVGGGLTLNGGALQNTAAINTARDITLGQNGGTFNTAATLNLNGFISGAGDLTKTGNGILGLSGDNDYTGQTSIDAGTLQTGAANVLADSSAIDISSGATFNLAGNNQSIRNLTGAGTVAMAAATLTVAPTSDDSFNGQFTGAGNLIKTGAATLSLTNNASQLNNVTVQQGTLDLTHPGLLTVTGNYTTNSSADTVLEDADESQLAVAGAFTQAADSHLEVTLGAESQPEITANTAALSGTLEVLGFEDNGGQPVKASEVVNGEQFVLIHTLDGISGNFVNNPLEPIAADYLLHTGAVVGNDYVLGFQLAWTQGDAATATGDFTLSEDEPFNVDIVLADRTGTFDNWDGKTLTKNGAGLLVLSADNTYSGGTIVNDGTLSISSDTNLGDAAGGLTLNGGTLETTQTLASARAVVLGGTATISVDDDTEFSASGIFSGAGALIKAGGGTLLLSGNNSYGGGTVVDAGTLSIAADDNLGAGASGLTLNGGTLQTTQTLASARAVVLGGSATISVDDDTQFSDSGTLSGAGTLTKAGGGTLLLSGNNSYGGGTVVNAGALSIAADDNLGAAASGLTLNDGTLETTQTLVSARAVVLDGTATINVDDDTEFSASGILSGAGALSKAGNGTLLLSGNNSYGGGTLIDDGTLSISADDNLGEPSGALTLNGGTLQTTRNIDTGRSVDIDGSGTISVADNTQLYASGLFSGSGELIKAGSGTLILSGDNSYTGGTVITGGTLQIGNGGETGSVAGDIVNDDSLIFDRDNILTFGGVISGTGSVIQGMGGRTILTSQNTYTGQTTINAGILQAGAVNIFADSSAIIANSGATLDLENENQSIHNLTGAGTVAMPGATLTINPTTDDTFDGQFSGAGNLVKTGTETLDLTNQASQLNDITVEQGTLALTHSGLLSMTGNYTTDTGATTVLANAQTSQLAVNGLFTQDADSRLNVSIDIQNQPEITANTAALAGTLDVSGFEEVNGAPVRSSEVSEGQQFVLIHTENGISGDFVNNPLEPSATDYLLHNGSVVGNDYVLGFKLAWTQGDANTSTGDFTISQDQPFNVDTILADRTGTFDNWDGKTLTKSGPGLLILSAANTYTGGTIVNAGTLSIAADANLGAASSPLTLNGGTLETTADITSARPVAIDGAAAISVDANTLLASSGAFSGNGALTKAGAGVLTLTGDSSAYTGNVTLAAGLLNANGVLDSAVAVQSGATLGGSGSVGALTVATGGTVAPGNSIGTLTVNGDATFAAGSVYQAQINPAGQADLLNVNGKAALNGGLVNVTSAPGNYAAVKRYTLLTASNGVTGQFAGLTTDLAFLSPTLEYDPDNVYLQFERNDANFSDYAGSGNQFAAANGAQSLGAGNRLYDALAALPNDTATVRHALNQISGELHASLKAALIEDSHFMRDGANDRLRSSFNDDGAAGGPTVMTYDQHGVAHYAPPTTDEAAFWGRIYGAKGSQDGNSNAASMSRDTHGAILGGDAPAGAWRVGALVGIGRSTFDIDSRNSSGDSDNYSVGVYAGTQAAIEQHTLAFRTGLIYTRNNIDTTRNVSFPGFSDRLSGDYSANSWQGFGEVAYPFKLEQTAIEPFDNLAVINLRTDGFSEHGAEAALQGQGDTSNTTFNTLGIRASQQFKAGSARLTANGMLGWRHAFGANTPTINQNFVGGSDFTIAGTPIAKDAAVVTVGLDMAIKEQGTVGLAYQGQLGNQSHENGLQATFAWKF